MKNVFDKKLIFYCLLGFANYVICTGLMFLLYNLGICDDHVAPLINYGLGGIIWYFGNVKLVFKQKQTPALVIRFILEIIVCYLLCYYILSPRICRLFVRKLASTAAKDNIRMAVGSVVYAIVNYFGQRFFVFREFNRVKRKHREEREREIRDTEENL